MNISFPSVRCTASSGISYNVSWIKEVAEGNLGEAFYPLLGEVVLIRFSRTNFLGFLYSKKLPTITLQIPSSQGLYMPSSLAEALIT